MPEPGVLEYKLFDGACIVDTFVEAPPEQAVAVFGEPVKLAEDGRRVDGVDLSAIKFYAASWPGVGCSVIEAASEEGAEDDYIVTMLRQASAALDGEVLDLPHCYENGLGLARQAASALGVPAVVVWGSDEWNSLGGGAQLDATGAIVAACNIADPEAIAKALADRQAMDNDDDDDVDYDDEEEGALYVYTPGSQLGRMEVDALEYLDGWLKAFGAPQPELPPSLIDHAATYFGEVWGAKQA